MKFNIDIDSIKYIKILYKDVQNFPYTIRSAIRKMDNREILACSKYDAGLKIETPQEITISFVCNDGLYRTKTVLKSVENDEPYVFFAMEAPQGLEYQQNREYFRVNAKYQCSYCYETYQGMIKVEANSFDISANGLSLICSEHMIPEEDANLTILIDEKKINAKIRYVRSEKLEDGYRISFKYSNITEQDRDFISQVCIKKQLEQKRNRLV